jgi:hypothetical protein
MDGCVRSAPGAQNVLRSNPRAFRTTMKESVGIMDSTLREFRFDRRCAPDTKNMSANLVISSAADVSSP